MAGKAVLRCGGALVGRVMVCLRLGVSALVVMCIICTDLVR